MDNSNICKIIVFSLKGVGNLFLFSNYKLTQINCCFIHRFGDIGLLGTKAAGPGLTILVLHHRMFMSVDGLASLTSL